MQADLESAGQLNEEDLIVKIKIARLPRLGQIHRRAVHGLLGLALALPSVAGLSALNAQAEAADTYPGGCFVAYVAINPSSCTYENLGGDPESIVFEGIGTATVFSSGPFCTSSQNFQSSSQPQTINSTCARQTYTVSLAAAAGTAYVVDSSPTWVNCVGFAFNEAQWDCSNTAPATGVRGNALAVVTSASPTVQISATLTVKDTTTGATVCTNSGTNFVEVTLECLLYPVTEGDHYDHIVTVTSGVDESIFVTATLS